MPTAGDGKTVRRKTVHRGHMRRIVYVYDRDCFCAGLRTFLDVVSPSDQSVSVCEFLCAQMACCACVHVCKHCVSATATGYRNSILALRASALRYRNAVASTCNGCGLGCSRNTLATCSCSASSITWCHRAQHAVTRHLVESIACQRHASAVPTHRCSLHANCLFLQHATLSRPDELIVFTVRLVPASCA